MLLLMKLSDYANKIGVTYKTAWKCYRSGKLNGYQTDTGTIIITEDDNDALPLKAVVYARVSSHEMKENLERQADRLTNYCIAKVWQVHKWERRLVARPDFDYLQFLCPSLRATQSQAQNRSDHQGTGRCS